MPRRASSGIHPGVLLASAAVIVVLVIGGKLLLGERSPAGLDGTRLDMNSVTENANALRGNRYVVEGVIDGQLDWDPDHGQVISLKVDGTGGSEFLAIEVPGAVATLNLEREQSYAFRIRFREGGIAVAEEITRL